MKRTKEMVVNAKDTYDPRDYITVHEQFFNGLKNAVREAHEHGCSCIYCAEPLLSAQKKRSAGEQ